MGFVIAYKPLFEIRLLHHYHLDSGGEGSDYSLFDQATAAVQEERLRQYDIASFLQVAPTADCAALLRKHQCLFRRLNDRIQVAIKVRFDNALMRYKPAVPLADDLCFTFRYSSADPDFLNYTNLPLQRDQDAIYFFRNRKEGGIRSYPQLAKTASKKVTNTIYDAGEILLSDDETTTIIADNITGPANTPSQTFTSDPKVNGAALVYINRSDLMPASGDLWNADTGLQDRSGDVTVTVTNGNGVTITPRIFIMEDGNTKVQVDFSPFPEGLYTVKMEDAGSAYNEERTFFLRKENVPCDGVLQLQVKSDDATFNLLNANGTIKEGNQVRTFLLRFKNRATVWRYLGYKLSNMPESGPYLLARNGFVNLTINDEDADLITDPANASVNMIRTERPVAAPDRYNLISEIFINS